jgi:excisionase family DNA binding protein
MLSPILLNSENSEWLTPKEAAYRIGVSSSFIYKLIKTNKLEASRVGSKLLRINITDLQAIYRPTFKSATQSVGSAKEEK